MSALYGSDAMGGVINIITRKNSDKWQGTVGMDYTMQQHDDSGNIANTNFFLGGPVFTNKLQLQLYGNGNFRNEDEIVGGYTGNNNRSVGGKLLFTPIANHQFTIDIGKSEQTRKATRGKTLVATSNTHKTKTDHTRTNCIMAREFKTAV